MISLCCFFTNISLLLVTYIANLKENVQANGISYRYCLITILHCIYSVYGQYWSVAHPWGKGGWGVKPPLGNQTLVFKVKCPNCASAVRAVILKQLRQNLPHIILKPNRLFGVVVRDIVIGAGRGRCGGCIPPPSILKHVFDEYNFSIILNLYDNNKPYTPSQHNRKCANKMHRIW